MAEISSDFVSLRSLQLFRPSTRGNLQSGGGGVVPLLDIL